MFPYPHTIENGHGERLTFLRRVKTIRGDVLEVENLVGPGSGPPMHVHHRQEEALTVQRGRMAYQRKGEEPQYAGPGETVVFLPGEWHRFWNSGTEDLVCTGYITPPDNVEYFLRGIFEAQKKGTGSRPDTFDAAYLMSRYKAEFGLDGIPNFVVTFIFPVQILIGRVLGKYRKFKDAPPPVAAYRSS